ncbi:MAG TPA: SRPBCC domain-containing protein [Chthoniobacterales bacterium]|nr:SRPBCC domain-containing protein [Chthoniobacterales bacterium]
MTATNPLDKQAEREFVTSRVFNAPRELVFDAWTNPEHLLNWSVARCTNDPRPGGMLHYAMSTPDGNLMWGKWIYREIGRPERLEVIQSFSDEAGGTAPHPLAPDWPREVLSVAAFEEDGGRTTLTIRWSPHNATEAERATFDAAYAQMQQGWAGMFDQFARYLAKQSGSMV